LKEKLQEKLKKSREEAEERKKEVEQLQSKVGHSFFSYSIFYHIRHSIGYGRCSINGG
jgi:hypothetical protein